MTSRSAAADVGTPNRSGKLERAGVPYRVFFCAPRQSGDCLIFADAPDKKADQEILHMRIGRTYCMLMSGALLLAGSLTAAIAGRSAAPPSAG